MCVLCRLLQTRQFDNSFSPFNFPLLSNSVCCHLFAQVKTTTTTKKAERIVRRGRLLKLKYHEYNVGKHQWCIQITAFIIIIIIKWIMCTKQYSKICKEKKNKPKMFYRSNEPSTVCGACENVLQLGLYWATIATITITSNTVLPLSSDFFCLFFNWVFECSSTLTAIYR